MVIHPWRKILTKRNGVARRARAGGASASARGSRVLAGCLASAQLPTLRSQVKSLGSWEIRQQTRRFFGGESLRETASPSVRRVVVGVVSCGSDVAQKH